MGTCISNQSGMQLKIEYCRYRDISSGQNPDVYRTVPVSSGGRHEIESSDLDVHQESKEAHVVGWRQFRFSIGGGSPLTFFLSNFKNDSYKNFECIVFRIGPGNVPTYTTLERTECRIYNKTKTTLLIKNYFISNVKTGEGSAGAFSVEVLPGKSESLKFAPWDIDWKAGEPWEQMEFRFSIDGHGTKRIPLSEIVTKKYDCKIGRRGFEVKPKEDHCCSCW